MYTAKQDLCSQKLSLFESMQAFFSSAELLCQFLSVGLLRSGVEVQRALSKPILIGATVLRDEFY